MKKEKRAMIFLHSASMVRKNIRCYLFLSVTIVLSFSLFLGYLLVTDSNLYNDYKELFAKDRNLVITSSWSQAQIGTLYEQANTMENTNAMVMFWTSSRFMTNSLDDDFSGTGTMVGMHVWCIPDNAWRLDPYTDSCQIIWLDGKEHNQMTPGYGEMLMNEGIYYALGLDAYETPYYTLKLSRNGVAKPVNLKVVGLIKDTVPLHSGEIEGVYDTDANENYDLKAIVSTQTLNPTIAPDVKWVTHFVGYTENPEQLSKLVESMGLYSDNIYQRQNDALEHIRYEKGNKAVIACALLLLLGINLYSSFSNALNERKFEIGVKRAIGASGWSIVRQFLYESLLVMVTNIVVSVVLVTDFFIAYKYVKANVPDHWGNTTDWTIYISPYSIGMFSICAVTLTVVFSLIFAYKSTRVEIVQYLKAE